MRAASSFGKKSAVKFLPWHIMQSANEDGFFSAFHRRDYKGVEALE
jgi:hypothetical protein